MYGCLIVEDLGCSFVCRASLVMFGFGGVLFVVLFSDFVVW